MSVVHCPVSTGQNGFERFNNGLTIFAFAQAAGVSVETIRLYRRKGLLSEPDKPLDSARRYGGANVTREVALPGD